MKIYRYLYYNLFRLWSKKKDESEIAHINAIITITFLLYVNIMSIPLIIVATHKYGSFKFPEPNITIKVLIGFILIGAGILNYILLARKQQHTKIMEEFKLDVKKNRKKGMVLTLFYLIFSLAIPLFISLFA
jgi:hypothetical protein